MPIKLTQQAKDRIMEDKRLFVEITEVLGIKLTSLYALIKRDSPTLSRHDVAKKIAASLNIPVDEIFEQSELVH